MAAGEGPVWPGSHISIPPGFQLPQRLVLMMRLFGLTAAAAGFACLILSFFTGPVVFDYLWGVEPLAYIGGVLLIVGLFAAVLGSGMARRQGATPGMELSHQWTETTRQFFELFDHDLGRPLRRIAGKERELRVAMRTSGEPSASEVLDLLDEIERQTVNYRLMLSNIQVLVYLESPGLLPPTGPVEPAEVVRRIADRYFPVAAEAGKELTWWAEPPDFGIVSSDSHAIEHIVANLVDNAVTHASGNVEISLSKDDSSFYVHVWDDGEGIASHYLEYLFDRGWTPEVGRREEKTSSGLGLFIARRLAQRCGGELTVESVAAPQADHHTAFLLALPLKGQ